LQKGCFRRGNGVTAASTHPFYFQQKMERVLPFGDFMSEDEKDKNSYKPILKMGEWLGRHQAFNLMAHRCTAADAECLKAIRDGGEYKKLGLTWAEFCEQHAGVSRVYAERQIHCFEEHGANYHRMAELMQISGETFKLIASAIDGDCIVLDGERIPLTRENRQRIAAGVKAVREKKGAGASAGAGIGPLHKRMAALLAEAHELAGRTDLRLELLVLLKEGREALERLSEELRGKTLLVR
jgi:hypothetical protein